MVSLKRAMWNVTTANYTTFCVAFQYYRSSAYIVRRTRNTIGLYSSLLCALIVTSIQYRHRSSVFREIRSKQEESEELQKIAELEYQIKLYYALKMRKTVKKKSLPSNQRRALIGLLFASIVLIVTFVLVLKIQSIGTSSQADEGLYSQPQNSQGDAASKSDTCPAKGISRGATRADGAFHECSVTCGNKRPFVRTRGTGYTPQQCDELAQTLCACTPTVQDPGKCEVKMIDGYCSRGGIESHIMEFECSYPDMSTRGGRTVKKGVFRTYNPICDDPSLLYQKVVEDACCNNRPALDASKCIEFPPNSDLWESLKYVEISMEAIRQGKYLQCDWRDPGAKCCITDTPEADPNPYPNYPWTLRTP